MAENPVRTIAVFSIIALILAGATIGGVRLIKARNDQYASGHAQSTSQPQVATDSGKDQNKSSTQQPTELTKKDDTNKNPATTPAPTQSPAPSNPQPSNPTPASQPTTTDHPASPTPPSGVAATGPQSLTPTGPSDLLWTVVLLMVVTFLGGQLLRARASFRRYLEQ